MTNVIDLPCVTTLDVPPERVLNAAIKADLAYVVIVGEDADGTEYFASSKSDGPECLWALERAKYKLLKMVDSEEDQMNTIEGLQAEVKRLQAENAKLRKHADALCERLASDHPVDQTIGAALPQEIYAYRTDFPKETDK